MVYGLTGRFVSFCSVLFGAGSVFFSFSVCIDVVIILRNEGNCIFLTINLKSFVYSQFFRHRSSLDFENIITKISPMPISMGGYDL